MGAHDVVTVISGIDNYLGLNLMELNRGLAFFDE